MKRIRQYLGIVVALVCYYVVHEGAHWLYAVSHGVFKQVNVMALGVQIDVFRDQLTDTQLGWFCLVGPLATLFSALVLVMLRNKICQVRSKIFRACAWYASIVMLLLDPLYIGFMYRFVGGGDMNGIKLLVPEIWVALCFCVVAVLNAVVLFKVLLPVYTQSFKEK
ncbi:MAG: hypothetical protein MJZ67_02725 [Bacteroidales bacterium]|nr:hypothetical protein [Bacteroidales bacterium]